MDLFLIHCLLLMWTSLGAARHLTAGFSARLLAAGLIAWGNLVATGLLLSMVSRLGAPAWFLGASAAIGLLANLVAARSAIRPAAEPADGASPGRPDPWLLGTCLLLVGAVAAASLRIAWVYPPNHPHAITYQLPRAIYYLGQGNLGHFDAADTRQLLLPFNFNALQLLGLVYGAPLQVLNFINLAAWAAVGAALYRICRLSGAAANPSLVAAGLALAAPQVLAQASDSTVELPAAAGLLCGLMFALQWSRTGDRREAALAGLAAGLSAGSAWTILLFLPAAILVLLGAGPGRQEKLGEVAGALLLALTAGLPFALIDLADSARRGQFAALLLGHGPSVAHLKESCLTFLAAFRPFGTAAVAEPGGAGFGIAGILALGTAVAGAARTRLSDAAGPVRLLATGWLVFYLLFPMESGPGAFVPVFLILTPCVALSLHSLALRPGIVRQAGTALITLVALAAAWSAADQLLHNRARPLAPILRDSSAAPAGFVVPLLPEFHLKKQHRINVDTDGVDEPILPFLTVGNGQRITSRHRVDPAAYNLISRLAASRQAAYRNDAQAPSTLLVAFPGKRTAGVEFLATVGRGASARDYYGLAADAGRTEPVESNSSVLVTVYPAPADRTGHSRALLRVQGLNPGDRARLVAEVRLNEGAIRPVAALEQDGDAEFAPPEPFSLLLLRLVDRDGGGERGSAALTYRPTGNDNVWSVDPSQPTNARSLFVTDAVLSRDLGGIACEGLLPVEGPFPQWNLPLFRWAVKPSVFLRIPADARLARLSVSFSVQPQVRHEAELEAYFNGKPVGRYSFTRRDAWQDVRLDLPAQPGENVLEFRDATYGTEPDWTDYLARYPDVKDYLLAQHVPLEQGAREHYETHGRQEGRSLKLRPSKERIPPPKDYYFIFRTIRLEGFRSE